MEGILKLSSNGEIEWQKTYGGSWDDVRSFQQTIDGGYIVAGWTGSFGAGGDDIWILKLSSTGDIEWQKTYGGSEYDRALSVQQTSDGGYIIAGKTDSFGAEGGDTWVLKLSSAGEIEWQKTFGGSSDDYASSIQETSDGGYIIAGKTDSFGAGGDDTWVLKLSSAGEIEWQKTYGGSSDDYASSIQETSDGGYLKLSSAGEIEWQKIYGESSWGIYSFQQTSDGGYIITGTTRSFNAGWLGDIWILKLSSNGDIEWNKFYGGDYSTDVASSVQQTSDGGYIVTGDTYSWGAGESDIWVLKLSPNGDIDPLCAFINTSDAEVSDTNIIPEDTDIIAADTDIIPEDTDITPQDTDISPQDSDANVYKLCVSNTCTLILSASSGGTTSPTPGTYTYDTGTEVNLNAVPSAGYDFLVWEGNVQASVRQITITMDGDKTISATFYKLPPNSGGYGEGDEWGGGGYDPGPSCFIATAAYGSPLHPYVRILRDFRDKYLMLNKFGRALIKIYYKYSPFLANFIANHKSLRAVVRIILLPLVAFSYLILHFGPIITGVMVIFIFMFPVFLVWRYKKKRRRHRKETKNKMIESFDT
jgi:hypothetical protein